MELEVAHSDFHNASRPSALALPRLLTLPVGSFKPASPKLEEASLVILL